MTYLEGSGEHYELMPCCSGYLVRGRQIKLVCLALACVTDRGGGVHKNIVCLLPARLKFDWYAGGGESDIHRGGGEQQFYLVSGGTVCQSWYI